MIRRSAAYRAPSVGKARGCWRTVDDPERVSCGTSTRQLFGSAAVRRQAQWHGLGHLPARLHRQHSDQRDHRALEEQPSGGVGEIGPVEHRTDDLADGGVGERSGMQRVALPLDVRMVASDMDSAFNHENGWGALLK